MTSVIQSDQPVCQGCGVPLSPDENYCCEDCTDWWALNGVEVSEHLRSESDGESA
ncbi:protein NinF [Rahnella bonaserana]